ncbi:MAG TPA: hypothetical protein VLV30_05320 [Methanomicrobiales archaeon]|nr:hypothetical protein [Methanomicrobiales archaeon]
MKRVPLVVFLLPVVVLAICISPVSAVVTLSIASTASPDPVMPGNQLVYTITATNSGNEPSFPLITFTYDPNLDYLSGSPLSNQEFLGNTVTNPAFWSSIQDDVTRNVEIDPGVPYVITVTTRVKAATPCGTILSSTATASDSGDDHAPSTASQTITTGTTCVVPAPEFPTPAIPAAMLGLLVLAILAIRSKVI